MYSNDCDGFVFFFFIFIAPLLYFGLLSCEKHSADKLKQQGTEEVRQDHIEKVCSRKCKNHPVVRQLNNGACVCDATVIVVE